MTNKEASDSARRIPFAPGWAELHPSTAEGIRRIVNRQLIRYNVRTHDVAKDARRIGLQYQTGVQGMPKAPGHDAAVKAGKARASDGYDVAAATQEAVDANYQADKNAYYRGRGR